VSVAAPVAVSGGGFRVSAPAMIIKETSSGSASSLRQDPDLRGELAFLTRGCDFVLPSRFKKRLKSLQQQQQQQQQQQVSRCNQLDGGGGGGGGGGATAVPFSAHTAKEREVFSTLLLLSSCPRELGRGVCRVQSSP